MTQDTNEDQTITPPSETQNPQSSFQPTNTTLGEEIPKHWTCTRINRAPNNKICVVKSPESISEPAHHGAWLKIMCIKRQDYFESIGILFRESTTLALHDIRVRFDQDVPIVVTATVQEHSLVLIGVNAEAIIKRIFRGKGKMRMDLFVVGSEGYKLEFDLEGAPEAILTARRVLRRVDSGASGGSEGSVSS